MRNSLDQLKMVVEGLTVLQKQQKEHFERIEDEQKKSSSWHISRGIPLLGLLAFVGFTYVGYAKFNLMDRAVADLQEAKAQTITKTDLAHVQREIALQFDKRDLQIEELSDDMLEVKAGINDIKALLLKRAH